jgi:translation elongation factor EF-1alpha
MPKKKSRAKKKVLKVKKVKKAKKKGLKVKKVKKVKAKRKAGKVKASKSPAALGKVIHYYDRIGVGIVKMAGSLRVGEHVLLKKGPEELRQQVTSMQVDHTPVMEAKKGQVIGLKVNQPVREGALLTKA